MVTKILLTIMLVLYIALLIMRYKKKGNPKIEGGVQVVQGILWSFIAVDSWAERSIGMRIVYIGIILMSFIVGIKGFIDAGNNSLFNQRNETKKGRDEKGGAVAPERNYKLGFDEMVIL